MQSSDPGSDRKGRMKDTEILEKLKDQTERFERIKEALSKSMTDIDLEIRASKRLIADIQGSPIIDAMMLNCDIKEELIRAGFMSEEEADGEEEKRLISYLEENVKGKLNRPEIRNAMISTVEKSKNGKIDNKFAYLKGTCKRMIENKFATYPTKNELKRVRST